MLPAILLFGGLLKASGEHAPCTWNATETEPCYLQIGGIFEYHDGMYDDDDNVRMNLPENDCSGHDPIPYIEAVNGLNGGRGFMVHSSGLEVAQSRPYPRYYYRLNFTRRSFRKGNWTHGDVQSSVFPSAANLKPSTSLNPKPKQSYLVQLSQRLQNPLVTEYALNHNRDPTII